MTRRPTEKHRQVIPNRLGMAEILFDHHAKIKTENVKRIAKGHLLARAGWLQWTPQGNPPLATRRWEQTHNAHVAKTQDEQTEEMGSWHNCEQVLNYCLLVEPRGIEPLTS